MCLGRRPLADAVKSNLSRHAETLKRTVRDRRDGRPSRGTMIVIRLFDGGHW